MESLLAKKCIFETTDTIQEFVPRMANSIIRGEGKAKNPKITKMKVTFARVKFPFHNDTLKPICLNVFIAFLKQQTHKEKPTMRKQKVLLLFM